jgi:hypothetical protein
MLPKSWKPTQKEAARESATWTTTQHVCAYTQFPTLWKGDSTNTQAASCCGSVPGVGVTMKTSPTPKCNLTVGLGELHKSLLVGAAALVALIWMLGLWLVANRRRMMVSFHPVLRRWWPVGKHIASTVSKASHLGTLKLTP